MKSLCFILLVLVFTSKVSAQDCVTYNFEEDFESEFNVNSSVCTGLAIWEIGYYEDFDIEPPSTESTAFIYPNTSLSCTSSFTFTIDTTGVLEVEVFMNSSNAQDQVIVLVQSVNEGSNDGIIGQGAVTSTNGWSTIAITWLSEGVYEGYFALTGLASEGSVVLVDSFRYVPSDYTEECSAYNDETTTTIPETTTESLVTETVTDVTTTDSIETTTEAIEATTESIETTTESIETTTESIEATTESIATTTESIEATTESIEATTIPIESTTELVESTTLPIETTTDGGEATTEPIESTTESIEATTEPIESTTETIEATTLPIESTTDVIESVPETSTDSPLQSTSSNSFWTPLTISAITLLCLIVLSLICWYFFEFGSTIARRALPPIVLEQDIEKLPRPLSVPRVTKVYTDNRTFTGNSIDKFPF